MSRAAVGLTVHYAVLSEKRQVECLTLGHLVIRCWGIWRVLVTSVGFLFLRSRMFFCLFFFSILFDLKVKSEIEGYGLTGWKHCAMLGLVLQATPSFCRRCRWCEDGNGRRSIAGGIHTLWVAQLAEGSVAGNTAGSLLWGVQRTFGHKHPNLASLSKNVLAQW